jgi:hypothetical protein
MTLAEIGVLASLALNLGIALVGATWGIAKIKEAVRSEIATHKEKIDNDLDQMGRSFGETAQAIRQKVHDIETWARDEFVRKGSFEGAVNRMEVTVGSQFAKLEARLERMEAKIDSKT